MHGMSHVLSHFFLKYLAGKSKLFIKDVIFELALCDTFARTSNGEIELKCSNLYMGIATVIFLYLSHYTRDRDIQSFTYSQILDIFRASLSN